MAERTRFYVYTEWLRPMNRLSDEQLGKFFRAYYEMQMTGNTDVEVDDPMVNLMLDATRRQVELDRAAYEQKCEVNRLNGAKGGRPKNPEKPKRFSEKPKQTQRNPEKADNDSDNDIDSPTENNNPPLSPRSGGKGVGYSSDPVLNEAIKEFVKHRKAMRKPMTEKAIQLFVSKLSKLAPGDVEKQVRLINTAIERGWQTVYEEDTRPRQVQNTFASGMMQRSQEDAAKTLAGLGNRNGNLI